MNYCDPREFHFQVFNEPGITILRPHPEGKLQAFHEEGTWWVYDLPKDQEKWKEFLLFCNGLTRKKRVFVRIKEEKNLPDSQKIRIVREDCPIVMIGKFFNA